jgi:hypothetical protein
MADVGSEIERLQRYLEALETARQALEEARRLYPDLGIDHALERLRCMISQGAMQLSQALDAAAEDESGERAPSEGERAGDARPAHAVAG